MAWLIVWPIIGWLSLRMACEDGSFEASVFKNDKPYAAFMVVMAGFFGPIGFFVFRKRKDM